MAGILDSKERVMDTLITSEGKRQAAAGHMRIYYASFTDRHTFYQDDGEGNIDNAENRLLLEAVSRPQDKIVIETDQEGKILPIKLAVSGAVDQNGDTILDLLIHDNKMHAQMMGKSLEIADSSGYVNIGKTFMNSISSHFDQQTLIMSPDMFETDNAFNMVPKPPQVKNPDATSEQTWLRDTSVADAFIGDVVAVHDTTTSSVVTSSITFELIGDKSSVGYAVDPSDALGWWEGIDMSNKLTAAGIPADALAGSYAYDTLPQSLESLPAIWQSWRTSHLPHYQFLPPIRKFPWGSLKLPNEDDIMPETPADMTLENKVAIIESLINEARLSPDGWPNLRAFAHTSTPNLNQAPPGLLKQMLDTAADLGSAFTGVMKVNWLIDNYNSSGESNPTDSTGYPEKFIDYMTSEPLGAEAKKFAVLNALYASQVMGSEFRYSFHNYDFIKTSYDISRLKAEITPSTDSMGRHETSIDNNMIVQFTESRNDGTFEKLAIIDFGDLETTAMSSEDSIIPPRMFFVGRLYTDGYDHPTFVNIFTVIMENLDAEDLIMQIATFDRKGSEIPPPAEDTID